MERDTYTKPGKKPYCRKYKNGNKISCGWRKYASFYCYFIVLYDRFPIKYSHIIGIRGNYVYIYIWLYKSI